jgi:hypothetical protein
MSFFSDQLTAALLSATTTDSVRSDLSSAFTTFRASLSTAIVTNHGRSATSAEVIDILDSKLIDLARSIGIMLHN